MLSQFQYLYGSQASKITRSSHARFAGVLLFEALHSNKLLNFATSGHADTFTRAHAERRSPGGAVFRVEERARAIGVTRRGDDALRNLPVHQGAAGDGIMPQRDETLGTVDGIDHPGAACLTTLAEVQPVDHFSLADGATKHFRKKRKHLRPLLGRDQLQKLLARFFRDDAIFGESVSSSARQMIACEP